MTYIVLFRFPIGMPPPNYMYPPNPWSMPWQQQVPPIGPDGKPIMPKPGMIDPQVRTLAHEFVVKPKLTNIFDFLLRRSWPKQPNGQNIVLRMVEHTTTMRCAERVFGKSHKHLRISKVVKI